MEAKSPITLATVFANRFYSPRTVSLLFDVSMQTVRNWCKSGKLAAMQERDGCLCPVEPTTEAGKRPPGKGDYYVLGSAILKFAGAVLLEQDRREAPTPPKPGDAEKRAAKRLKELEKLQAEKKK